MSFARENMYWEWGRYACSYIVPCTGNVGDRYELSGCMYWRFPVSIVGYANFKLLCNTTVVVCGSTSHEVKDAGTPYLNHNIQHQ